VVSLSCLVSCGSDLLDSCLKETDGTLDCSFAEFNNVDLSGRDLRNVDFSNADLEQADLTGADLSWTDFHWLEGTGAKADDGTVWPEGFDPVAAGVIFE